jgi:hypothetical protein
MRVPNFKDPEVTKYLIDLAKDREQIEKIYVRNNQANHSVLLQSPNGKVWELRVNDTGAVVTTLVLTP